MSEHLISNKIMPENDGSEIGSNLSAVKESHKDPIVTMIPPPLEPSEVSIAKKKAYQVIKEVITDPEAELVLEDLDNFDLSKTQIVLEQKDFDAQWHKIISEEIIDRFVSDGFIVLDNVYGDKALMTLQAESGFVEYRDAMLTDGVRKTDIRGDRIRWITEDFFAGYYYLNSINQLAQLFNRYLFAGIRHSEAHYACYPVGFGYKWHQDNPVGRDERVISAVFYLNDEWTPEDGGELSVIDNQGKQHKLLPKANRLVVFDSNLLHQVETAYRQRYSIATWLRRDDAVIITESF